MNFVGGQKQIYDSQDKINRFLMQKNVKWVFNPPRASQHGGVWECCIHTVRKVLNATTKEQTLNDKRLSTLMWEVKVIVNNQLIMKISDDLKDFEALTPPPPKPPVAASKRITPPSRGFHQQQCMR